MNNSRKQVINLLSDSENDDEEDDFHPKSKAKPNADNSNTIVNSLLARLQSKSTLRIGKSHQSLKENSDKMTRSKDVFKAIKIEQSRAGGINCSSSTSSSSSSSTIIKNETNPINEKILGSGSYFRKTEFPKSNFRNFLRGTTPRSSYFLGSSSPRS